MLHPRSPFDFVLALGALACVGALSGCDKVASLFGPREGQRCEVGTATCLDTSTELFCDDGKFRKRACTGKAGCAENGTTVTCNWGADQIGDPCATDEEGHSSCGTEQTLLKCKSHALVELPCRGPTGCVDKGGEVLCDRSVGEAGDPCEKGGACTADKLTYLTCKDGKLDAASPCRGPDGCTAADEKVTCDVTLSAEGDPCEGDVAACAVDKKTYLRCAGGKLEKNRTCRGTGGCARKNDLIDCDLSIAEAGEPCDGDGLACSIDLRSLLACKDGKLVQTHACACEAKDGMVGCK